jgi:hypothetical protein
VSNRVSADENMQKTLTNARLRAQATAINNKLLVAKLSLSGSVAGPIGKSQLLNLKDYIVECLVRPIQVSTKCSVPIP